MGLYLEAACGSSKGRIRVRNEDNFYFNRMTRMPETENCMPPLFCVEASTAVCCGVFDGIGGAADGQIASCIAARTFQADCELAESAGVLSEALFEQMAEHMNDAVCVAASRNVSNMGTTAAMLGVCGDAVYICNVGDSRVYRFRDDVLTQLSRDHAAAIPPFLEGKRKPALSQWIGIPPEEMRIVPHIVRSSLESGDVYLLCSDGLTDMVTDEGIASLFRLGGHADDAAQRLINAALAAGGRDNVTVIVMMAAEEAQGRHGSGIRADK